MDQEEAIRKAEEIRLLFKGHPPRDPVDILDMIDGILSPSKRRKARGGFDREERGGTDREE